MQLILCEIHLISNSNLLTLFFGFSSYICAFCEDFQQIFTQIDQNLKNKSVEHSLEVNRLLIEAFKFEKKIIRYDNL